MKPIDYRTATFQDIRGQLTLLRAKTWDALDLHGPCTTRELARDSGLDLLTVRPRVTELVQLGFAECVNEDQAGHEGIYKALTTAEAEALFERRKLEAADQLTLF